MIGLASATGRQKNLRRSSTIRRRNMEIAFKELKIEVKRHSEETEVPTRT